MSPSIPGNIGPRRVTASQTVRYLAAAGFLLGALWSGARYLEVAEALYLARLSNAEAGPILADPAPDDASALWLDTYSERLTEKDSIGARLRALDAARRAVQANPQLTGSWNRIAWLNIAMFGRLTAEAERALEAGFAATPFGPPELMRWRIRLAATVWDDLSPALRGVVATQIDALGEIRRERTWLRREAMELKNEELAGHLLRAAAQRDR